MTKLPLFPELNIISFPPAKPKPKRSPCVKPSGKIAPFPLARRASMIRRLAAELEARTGEFRDGFWFDAIGALEEQLGEVGFSGEEILRQLRGFRAAVQFEIDAIGHRGGRQGGDAA